MIEGERLYRTEAVVLKRMDFGEADRLLTLYTPELGKIRVVAKGVRKPTSRKAGHLELFMRSGLLLARGRNLDIVTQAETLDPFLPLRTDLWRVSHACYAEGEENYPLYNLLVEALGWICEETDLDRATRFYELRLLGYVGFRPQLFSCAACQEEIKPMVNHFSPERGGVLCPRCGPNQLGAETISLNALKVLRFFQTREYSTCRQVSISSGVHREAERAMYCYIVYHLERQLKSTAFLELLRRQRSGAG